MADRNATDTCPVCPPYLRSIAADFPCSECGRPLCRHTDAGCSTCSSCAAELSEQADRDILEQQADAAADYWS